MLLQGISRRLPSLQNPGKKAYVPVEEKRAIMHWTSLSSKG